MILCAGLQRIIRSRANSWPQEGHLKSPLVRSSRMRSTKHLTRPPVPPLLYLYSSVRQREQWIDMVRGFGMSGNSTRYRPSSIREPSNNSLQAIRKLGVFICRLASFARTFGGRLGGSSDFRDAHRNFRDSGCGIVNAVSNFSSG